MILRGAALAAEARLKDARHALTKKANRETEEHFKETLQKIEAALEQLRRDLANTLPNISHE